jgi:hypothetical protein
MMMKPRRSVWNTYAIHEYIYDVADQSQELRHLYQVRRLKGGGWQERIVQTIGPEQAPQPVQAITDAEGEAHYAAAVQRAVPVYKARVRWEREA